MSGGAGREDSSATNSPDARKDDENESDDNSNQPDLGLGHQSQTNRKATNESQAGSSEVPRREENPFSFKHFLSRETASGACGGQNTGARPKVFTSPTSSSSSSSSPHPSCSDHSRNSSSRSFSTNPDLASVLPDFVQDHLVVEQCYLRDSVSSALMVDLDNLPDFAVKKDTSSASSGVPRSRQATYSNFSLRRDRNQNSSLDCVPLDLPNACSSPSSNDIPASGTLPFDLPLVRDGNSLNAIGTNSPSGSPVQPNVSKSLPDFLSDGPIRGGHLPPADVTAEASNLPEDMFQTENERLRAEVEILRRQNAELSRRLHSLQTEVRTLRVKEHEDTVTMEKALEQAEETLQRNIKRAVNAENMLSKVKQELKTTQSELRQVQQENWELRSERGGSGACGGSGASNSSSSSSNQQIQFQRFAQELKAAASTAESSLRQLMSGVDSLRLLASTMENLHRVEDRTGDYISDSDDAGGPTL